MTPEQIITLATEAALQGTEALERFLSTMPAEVLEWGEIQLARNLAAKNEPPKAGGSC
jgi:hypothetical protein